MIKKFINSSFIYAGSALLFSVGRQILFFPVLNRISPELFVEISFLIILIDFIIYSMGASVADFYVRQVTPIDKKVGLYKFLFYFLYFSLFSFFIFFIYDIDWLISIIFSVYVLFYAFNTLQMKCFFNNLEFSKNYKYVLLRLSPYFLLLLYDFFIGINSFLFFSLFLLLFEIMSFYSFKLQLSGFYKEINGSIPERDYNLFYFIGLYFILALLFRFDMFIVEFFFKNKFSEYYQMMSVYMIFVNPVVLLTSSSLLSILTKVELKQFIKNKIKILIVIFVLSLFFGLLFQVLGGGVVKFLYPSNKLIEEYKNLSFLVIFTTLSFLILKTFVLKYSLSKNIAIGSIFSMLIPLFFLKNFLYFIITFFILRSMVFLYNYGRIKL